MEKEIRKKAYRALLNAQTAGGKHFPRVWVCGTHVFFTQAAAILQKKEYAILDGVLEFVEEVTYAEAAKHDITASHNVKYEVDWGIESK